MSELIYYASLTNKLVYESASQLLKDFPWQTQLVKELNDQFGITITDTDPVVLKTYLTGKLVENEIDTFIESVNDFKKIESEKQIKVILNNLFDYYRTNKVVQIIKSNTDNHAEIVKRIKEIPESIVSNSLSVNIATLNPEEIFKEEVGGDGVALPSQFDLIRKSTPFNGYLPGSVVSVCAAPGSGKSAWMLYETTPMAMMGKSVLYVIMGDLMKFDFLTRFTAVATSVDYFKVVQHPNKYYLSPEIQEIAKNIELIALPSRKLSAKQLISFLKSSPTRYDVIVIDYDSNFEQPSDSMYESGGAIYDDLTEIARPDDQPNRLVFVASQPKNHYWKEEMIPEDGLAESSRKQHIIDMMITIGRAESPYPIGILNIAKNRRGTTCSVPIQRSNCGHFRELTPQEYAMMKTYSGGSKK